MESIDELEVVREVLHGDTAAFRLLVTRYEGPVYSLVRNLVMDEHDGEDIAQEVFLATYANLSSFDSRRSSFSTWLFTIARNKCLNWLRRKRPIARETAEELASFRTPEVEAVEDEFFGELDRALARLPMEQRTAFVLAEIEGLAHAQIAEIEGIRVGTVKSRVSRAKATLRSVLQQSTEHQ